MKYCAVICEYNPFHNGHLYQLERARELTSCDGIVCIMSGDFVQRAQPAIINKLARTRCALLCGADLVIELPTLYAVSNGETFAKGAVDIVCQLPNIEQLIMGCETDDTNALFTLADIQSNETSDFKSLLSSELKKGISYAQSYANITAQIGEKHGIRSTMSHTILSKPNNLLCIEYIKALKSHKSGIKPLIIKRNGDDYNCEKATSETTSATAIRNILQNSQSFDDIKRYVPHCTFDILINEFTKHTVNSQTFSDLIMFTLKNLNIKEFSALNEVSEGIEYRFAKAVASNVYFDNMLNEVKTKRYTMSRVKRICLNAMLGINNSVMSNIKQTFARVLGIKDTFKHYLSALPNSIYVRITDNDDMDTSKRILYEIDKRASEIYSLLTHDKDYSFYNKLISV